MEGLRGHWGRWGHRGLSCLKSGINDSGDKIEKNLSFKKLLTVESLIMVFKLEYPISPQKSPKKEIFVTVQKILPIPSYFPISFM
ncbi:MAG: hypothetical protein LBB88_04530 [Planctomycetaceae bacterium]|nr:hypothetical protein [Planctomycetaceae bacterium]